MRGIPVFFILVACLTGQENDFARRMETDAAQRANLAAKWLLSGDPQQIAWGARVARVDHLTSLIPLLVKQVLAYKASETGARSASYDAMLVVVDALIELKGAISSGQARRLFPEFAAQSVILLVRSPDRSPDDLFGILDNAKADWTWLAVGNALWKDRAPGFAFRLLDKFTRHLKINVFDPNTGGGEGGGVSECGSTGRAPKSGWPPVGLYQLMQFPDRFPQANATFLVGGPTPVYYFRMELGGYDNPPDVAGACDDGDRDVYRAQYLTQMAELSVPRIRFDAYPNLNIEWLGEGDFHERVSSAIEQQRKQFRDAVMQLRGIPQWLSPDEAASLKPRIEVTVRDRRQNQSLPLPALGDLGNGATLAGSPDKPLN